MRVEFLQSFDFNQMLVYSSFAHLFFLTLVMFLPDPRTQEQIVVPTFRLDLIELSPATKLASAPNTKQEVAPVPVKEKVAPKVKPIAKKLKRQKVKKPVLKPRAKQLPPPKPLIRESKARKKILADLESLDSHQPKKSVLKELDQLARLAPEIQAKKPLPPKVTREETFKEIERKKTPGFPIEPEPVKPLLPKATKEETAREIEGKKASQRAKFESLLDDLRASTKERELAALSEKSVKLDSREETQIRPNLIQELEEMEKKEIHPADILVEESQLEKLNPSSTFDIKGESLTSGVKKIDELEDPSEEIKIDISQGQMVLKEFKTTIKRSKVPVSQMYSDLEASSPLSLYVGKVVERVYSNWKTPLGSKDKNLVVSFSIFSEGNINNPTVRESTRDKNLDAIAVRAIIDSAPFPMLPEELQRPNLEIKINFKYVPEKK